VSNVNVFRPLRPGRLLAALALATSTAVLAACGGGLETGAAGSALPDGASHVPASVPVFVALDTSFDSDGWQSLNALLARFPSAGKLTDNLTSSLTKNGVDFERDVKPALGPETDIALLDLPAEGDPTVVLLTKPSDPSKLEALLAKADEPLQWKVVDGWYVVAETKAAVDRAVAGADQASLADASAFGDSLGELAGSPVARVYLNGPALTAALQKSIAEDGSLPFDLGSLGTGGAKLDSVAIGVSAEGQGVRVEGVAKTEGVAASPPHKAELTSLVPRDALVYASFSGLQDGLKKLLDTVGQQVPSFDTSLSQIELALGVSLEQDVLPIFAGEGALYVRAGAPIPEVTLVLSPEDPTKALATLDKLVAGIGSYAGLSGGDVPFTKGTETIAGQPFEKLSFGKVDVYYGVVKNHLVVTTAVKGIADLVAGSGSLADDPGFQQATAAAGLPAESSGFVYVNLSGAVDALDTAGVFDQTSPETLSNLRPLDYLVAYVAGGESQTRFAGFLGIK
jgi:hypothetical protein